MVILAKVDKFGAVERLVSRSSLLRVGNGLEVPLFGAGQISADFIDRGKQTPARNRLRDRIPLHVFSRTGFVVKGLGTLDVRCEKSGATLLYKLIETQRSSSQIRNDKKEVY